MNSKSLRAKAMCLLLSVTLTLDMFSSKSTFAGGETYLQIESDTMERLVDEGTGETVGVYRIELEIPEDEDSYCFRYTLDQHSNHGTTAFALYAESASLPRVVPPIHRTNPMTGR